MRRRDFIAALSAAATGWPLTARSQQAAMPVIGLLQSGFSNDARTAAFFDGLGSAGFVDGVNVVIEYRWAGDSLDQWPTLAADLVRRQVTVIVARGSPATVAAKSATAKIPIVFQTGGDPVKLGLVESLNRPGGNATGLSRLSHALAPKQLELLHELAPKTSAIAVVTNPNNPNTASDLPELHEAARLLPRTLHILQAATKAEIDIAIETLIARRAGAMLIANDGFFLDQKTQFIEAAARHSLPAIYSFREFVDSGGLLSYEASSSDSLRQVGVYTARILKGEKPADLPVQQASKIELVVNLKTAKDLGLTIQPTLLARADEVIE